jgi:hypothetical protein
MKNLVKEQLNDLHWATDVLSGRGDEHDNSASAINMLSALAKHGATQQIKQAASVMLVQGVAEAA